MAILKEAGVHLFFKKKHHFGALQLLVDSGMYFHSSPCRWQPALCWRHTIGCQWFVVGPERCGGPTWLRLQSQTTATSTIGRKNRYSSRMLSLFGKLVVGFVDTHAERPKDIQDYLELLYGRLPRFLQKNRRRVKLQRLIFDDFCICFPLPNFEKPDSQFDNCNCALFFVSNGSGKQPPTNQPEVLRRRYRLYFWNDMGKVSFWM